MKNRIILAIKGLGTAGSARLKAIHELEDFELGGICSRRPEIQTRSWQEVLEDPQVEAVAISTENTDHEKSVREALQYGKHVLCDYPLAFSLKTFDELYALAKIQKKVLHVEHIALLTQAHLAVKQKIQDLGPLQQGFFRFEAGWNANLSDYSKQGDFVFLVESRLLQLADWFGDFSMLCKVDRIQHLFDARLTFSKGGSLHFQEKRQEGLKRQRTLELEMKKGKIFWDPLEEKESLFKKDLVSFYKRVREGAACYYDEEIMKKIIGKLEGLL